MKAAKLVAVGIAVVAYTAYVASKKAGAGATPPATAPGPASVPWVDLGTTMPRFPGVFWNPNNGQVINVEGGTLLASGAFPNGTARNAAEAVTVARVFFYGVTPSD
jgi:hypothetical protein